MIKGDEGKPMSLLEYISDEPRDVEPYIEMLLKDYAGRMEDWSKSPNDHDPSRPTARDCVLHWMRTFQIELESILLKLRRERAERGA